MIRYVELGPDHLSIRRGDRPVLRPGEARVTVVACGLCGTDAHMRHGMVLPPGTTYPVRPGHEVVGMVTEFSSGDGIGELQLGDLVVLHPLDSCGSCASCQSGNEQRCRAARMLGIQADGGLADEVAWPARRLVPAAGVTPTMAALLPDAVATAYHAYATAGVAAGEQLIVIGAGGVGTHVLQIARAVDSSVRLTAIVRSEATAARLFDLDPDINVLVGLAGAARRIRDSAGLAAAVVDLSGSAEAVSEGLRTLDRGGRYVLGSIVDEPLSVSMTLAALTTREIRLIGSYSSSIEDLRIVTWLVQDGLLDLSRSVSLVLPLDDVGHAFDVLDDRPPGMVRIVMTC
ncbi:MAG TPA: alcohol dehydrogenase catalytic domain-containing protein [Mycobacterium sp.]|nr:alcohol dehydrogenase catalytic domain-containing protein [Mycobacterium sp.]